MIYLPHAIHHFFTHDTLTDLPLVEDQTIFHIMLRVGGIPGGIKEGEEGKLIILLNHILYRLIQA